MKNKPKYVLIKDNQLDMGEFKKVVKELSWTVTEREIGSRKERFYVGVKEDDEKRIRVKIMPCLTMSVQETFKQCTQDGNLAPANFPGNNMCEFGASVENRISDSFLTKLLSVIKINKKNVKNKKLEW